MKNNLTPKEIIAEAIKRYSGRPATMKAFIEGCDFVKHLPTPHVGDIGHEPKWEVIALFNGSKKLYVQNLSRTALSTTDNIRNAKKYTEEQVLDIINNHGFQGYTGVAVEEFPTTPAPLDEPSTEHLKEIARKLGERVRKLEADKKQVAEAFDEGAHVGKKWGIGSLEYKKEKAKFLAILNQQTENINGQDPDFHS